MSAGNGEDPCVRWELFAGERQGSEPGPGRQASLLYAENSFRVHQSQSVHPVDEAQRVREIPRDTWLGAEAVSRGLVD